VNGFPYGPFHGVPVKEEVYRPDWRATARRDYTLRLAGILAALLPEGVDGSISTVPCSYKAWIRSDEDVRQMARMLAECAGGLAALHERTGRAVRLGLEPEPDCWIETTEEAVRFFGGPLREHGAARLAETAGLSASGAEACLARHVGLCLDTCHAALAFEDPAAALARLGQAGIRVPKVQVSAALRTHPAPEALRQLAAFCDPVYLHQTRVRAADGTVRAYPDLRPALDAGGDPAGEEWRVHFHVPVYAAPAAPLRSTNDLLAPAFWAALRAGATSHVEIETYTFDVLPAGMERPPVGQSIAREYTWVLERLGEGDSKSS
jgi:hypothetical protein